MTTLYISIFIAGTITGAAGMWLAIKDKHIVHVHVQTLKVHDDDE